MTHYTIYCGFVKRKTQNVGFYENERKSKQTQDPGDGIEKWGKFRIFQLPRKKQLKSFEEYSIITRSSLYIIPTVIPKKMKGAFYEKIFWQTSLR